MVLAFPTARKLGDCSGLPRRTDPKAGKQALRVLLIDADQDRAMAVKGGLEASGCSVVAVLPDTSGLLTLARQIRPEVIVCDLEDPSRDALESMEALHRDEPMPIVLFAAKAGTEQIQAALQAGVAAYVMEGLAPERLRPVLEVTIHQFRAHQSLRTELAEAKQSLAEREIIDRAKQRLMRERGWSEPDAYRRLRRMAMDRGQRIFDVAAAVLSKN